MRLSSLLKALFAASFQVSFSKSDGSNRPGISACLSLVASIDVQFSGPKYDAAAHGAWNLFNTDFQPTCVVFPRSSSDVQTTMKAIYHTGAQYAVHAGGHSAMKGWNNVQNGVLIDFSQMRHISYDSGTDSIVLEPGVRWGDALSSLESQGVAPVGGRQGDVGTGLLLGGGLSFLSPAHGFAADSFKRLDVVLVTGELVTATADNEYADLFRALKGGGNRFGIVTRFELHAVHTGTKDDKTWFGGIIYYPNSSAEAVVTAVGNYVRDVKDPKAALLSGIINTVQAGSLDAIAFTAMFYNGTELPASIFGEFLSIPAITKELGPLSYYDITRVLPPGNERGHGQHYGASALVGESKLYLDAFRHWTNFTDIFRSDIFRSVLAFTPVLDPQIRAGRAKGGNSINPPDGGYALVVVAQEFSPGVTSISPEVDRGIQLTLSQIPRSPGIPLFLNECDERQNVYGTYGDFEQLKRTYAKYDPTRFNIRHTNGPLGL